MQIVLEEIRQRLKDGLPTAAWSPLRCWRRAWTWIFPRYTEGGGGQADLDFAGGGPMQPGNRSALPKARYGSFGEKPRRRRLSPSGQPCFTKFVQPLRIGSSPEAVQAYTQSLFLTSKAIAWTGTGSWTPFTKGVGVAPFLSPRWPRFRLIDVPTRSVSCHRNPIQMG